MLIIDGNSVYEIDEECVRKKKVPKECGIYEKMMQQQNREKDREYAARDQAETFFFINLIGRPEYPTAISEQMI